jgi:hypothetical protein
VPNLLDPRRVRCVQSRARDYDGSAILQTRVRDEPLDRPRGQVSRPSSSTSAPARAASVALKRRYRASA